MTITFSGDCTFQVRGNKKVTINTVDGVHHAKCECGHKWKFKGVPKTLCDKCHYSGIRQNDGKIMSLKDTLGNEAWLRANEDKVKALLPETLTHVSNLNVFQLGFKLKILGIDWRSKNEFGRVMVYLEKIGFMLREGQAVKRNPNTIFRN